MTQDADATCLAPIMPFDGWQAQGPTFCGTGVPRHPRRAVSPTTAPIRRMVIGSWLSGAIRLGGLLHAGVNALTVRITSSAANHYYRGTGLQGDGLARCGLLAAPVLRPVRRWHDIDGLLA